MQRLLNFYPWDVGGVRDGVRGVVVECLADERYGVLIVDETGFEEGDEVGWCGSAVLGDGGSD